jgi:hypothetical protein
VPFALRLIVYGELRAKKAAPSPGCSFIAVLIFWIPSPANRQFLAKLCSSVFLRDVTVHHVNCYAVDVHNKFIARVASCTVVSKFVAGIYVPTQGQ